MKRKMWVKPNIQIRFFDWSSSPLFSGAGLTGAIASPISTVPLLGEEVVKGKVLAEHALQADLASTDLTSPATGPALGPAIGPAAMLPG